MPQWPSSKRKRGRAQTFHWGLIPGISVYKTDALPLSYGGDRAAMIALEFVKCVGCAVAEHRDLKTFSSWPVGQMDKAYLRGRRFQIRGHRYEEAKLFTVGSLGLGTVYQAWQARNLHRSGRCGGPCIWHCQMRSGAMSNALGS